MTEDKMVGWHYQLDGHELQQALEYGDGRGSLVCCSPWGRRESDTTEQLNNNKIPFMRTLPSRPNHRPKAPPPNTII